MQNETTKKFSCVGNEDDAQPLTETTDIVSPDSMSEDATDISIPETSLEETANQDAAAEPGQDLVRFEPKPVALTEPDHINIANQLACTVPTRVGQPEHEVNAAVHGSLALYADINPSDALESILARLLVGTTNGAMAANSHAANAAGVPQYYEQYSKISGDHALLTIKLIEALDRHRGLQQQNVNVNQVNVHSGGQAVVGNVTRNKKNDTPSAEPVPENGQTSDDEDED